MNQLKAYQPSIATRGLRVLAGLLCGWLMALAPNLATAQIQGDDVPEIAKGISVEQKMGADLPMHLEFEDDKNRFLQFGEMFKGEKPVLLSFNYSDCPQLCSVQLNNFVDALLAMDLVPGKDFEFVSVSIDPTEQSKQLAETKQNYVVAYGNLESADGWHFLRGTQKNIRALADACGFNYKYIPETRQYSHPAAFIFCTADGRISRYIDGLSGTLDRSIKPALVEASQGKIGSFADKVKYFAGCYYFDPTTGKYSTSAIGLMRLAGMVTIIGLVVGIAPFWIRRSLAEGEVKEIKDIDQSSEDDSEATSS